MNNNKKLAEEEAKAVEAKTKADAEAKAEAFAKEKKERAEKLGSIFYERRKAQSPVEGGKTSKKAAKAESKALRRKAQAEAAAKKAAAGTKTNPSEYAIMMKPQATQSEQQEELQALKKAAKAFKIHQWIKDFKDRYGGDFVALSAFNDGAKLYAAEKAAETRKTAEEAEKAKKAEEAKRARKAEKLQRKIDKDLAKEAEAFAEIEDLVDSDIEPGEYIVTACHKNAVGDIFVPDEVKIRHLGGNKEFTLLSPEDDINVVVFKTEVGVGRRIYVDFNENGDFIVTEGDIADQEIAKIEMARAEAEKAVAKSTDPKKVKRLPKPVDDGIEPVYGLAEHVSTDWFTQPKLTEADLKAAAEFDDELLKLGVPSMNIVKFLTTFKSLIVKDKIDAAIYRKKTLALYENKGKAPTTERPWNDMDQFHYDDLRVLNNMKPEDRRRPNEELRKEARRLTDKIHHEAAVEPERIIEEDVFTKNEGKIHFGEFFPGINEYAKEDAKHPEGNLYGNTQYPWAFGEVEILGEDDSPVLIADGDRAGRPVKAKAIRVPKELGGVCPKFTTVDEKGKTGTTETTVMTFKSFFIGNTPRIYKEYLLEILATSEAACVWFINEIIRKRLKLVRGCLGEAIGYDLFKRNNTLDEYLYLTKLAGSAEISPEKREAAQQKLAEKAEFYAEILDSREAKDYFYCLKLIEFINKVSEVSKKNLAKLLEKKELDFADKMKKAKAEKAFKSAKIIIEVERRLKEFVELANKYPELLTDSVASAAERLMELPNIANKAYGAIESSKKTLEGLKTRTVDEMSERDKIRYEVLSRRAKIDLKRFAELSVSPYSVNIDRCYASDWSGFENENGEIEFEGTSTKSGLFISASEAEYLYGIEMNQDVGAPGYYSSFQKVKGYNSLLDRLINELDPDVSERWNDPDYANKKDEISQKKRNPETVATETGARIARVIYLWDRWKDTFYAVIKWLNKNGFDTGFDYDDKRELAAVALGYARNYCGCLFDQLLEGIEVAANPLFGAKGKYNKGLKFKLVVDFLEDKHVSERTLESNQIIENLQDLKKAGAAFVDKVIGSFNKNDRYDAEKREKDNLALAVNGPVLKYLSPLANGYLGFGSRTDMRFTFDAEYSPVEEKHHCFANDVDVETYKKHKLNVDRHAKEAALANLSSYDETDGFDEKLDAFWHSLNLFLVSDEGQEILQSAFEFNSKKTRRGSHGEIIEEFDNEAYEKYVDCQLDADPFGVGDIF